MQSCCFANLTHYIFAVFVAVAVVVAKAPERGLYGEERARLEGLQ